MNGVPFNPTYCYPYICDTKLFENIYFLISFYIETSEKNHLFKMGFIGCCYLEEDLLSSSIYQEV